MSFKKASGQEERTPCSKTFGEGTGVEDTLEASF